VPRVGGEGRGDRGTEAEAAVRGEHPDTGDLGDVTDCLAAPRRDRTVGAESRGEYRLA